MDFVSFDSGVFFQSKLAVGDIPDSDFVSIEWRFGPGLSQMAHRFQVPADAGNNGDGGAGVPDSVYTYEDYVEVPFQVWDIDNNKQLMVSFRDQQRDGVFNLNPRDTDNDPGLLNTREYFYAHAVDYDPDNPDASAAIHSQEKARFVNIEIVYQTSIVPVHQWTGINVTIAFGNRRRIQQSNPPAQRTTTTLGNKLEN